MAGVYLHIPFCSRACHYCDFHFSTIKKQLPNFHQYLMKEMELRDGFFSKNIELGSIYFGGGTPSLLEEEQVKKILGKIKLTYWVRSKAEVTLEANPEDITAKKIQEWKNAGVNRLSIGVQSFFDDHLKYFNRIHSAEQAYTAIKIAQDNGIENITTDLIYGFPLLSDEQWNENIEKLIELAVPHISSYALTVEPGTALSSFIKKGKLAPISDEQSQKQFDQLREKLIESGFDHYEVSNFAKPEKQAIHNSNYWNGISYLGLGPGAHGFKEGKRYWNKPNNAHYIKATSAGHLFEEQELLTEMDRLNELVLTGLRTKWGISKSKLKGFSNSLINSFNKDLAHLIQAGKIVESSSSFILNRAFWFYADGIASDLFQLEP